MKPSQDFRALMRTYESELLEDVMPWWIENGIDRDHGGIFHALAQDGTVLSGDKSMWSQGRALWTFSALYNRVGRRAEWLELAHHLFEFVMKIGRTNDWVWPQTLNRDGTVKVSAQRIYGDGFAIMGLTEYARATGSEEAAEAALTTYDTVRKRMAVPGTHLDIPENLVGAAKCQGISMIFSIVFHELGKLLDDAGILQAGYEHAVQILDDHRHPELGLLVEQTALDGSVLGSPQGHHVNPGHAVESMWFLIHIFRERRERPRIDQAVECIRWHIEKAWDAEYGGMFTFLDLDGKPIRPDSGKAFWPHGEALYALLLAHEYCGEQWCLDWYDKMHEWTFAHFPDRRHGEWREKVQRDGSVPKHPKDRPPGMHTCFHLPRTLMMCIDVLERLSAGK
jgi:N-acylglucosamine 2-epimerase